MVGREEHPAPVNGRQPDDALLSTPAAVQAVAAREYAADQFVTRDGARGLAKRVASPAARKLLTRVITALGMLSSAVERAESDRVAQSRETSADLAALLARIDDLERLELTRREHVRALADRVDTLDPSGVSSDDDILDADGYVEFERRFRGSRESILERQRDAVQWVSSLVGSDAPALDLGCGRGEWLQVLKESSVPAIGVDSNTGMVEAARAAGLDVRLGDLLEYLEAVEPGTLGAVTGFHVAEHLPLPVLRRLIDAAFVALRPGGILLMETPNPMNIVVGASSFYLDPTHLRPVHPHFFQFLVEHRGFEEVHLHYVHPADASGIVGPDEVDSAAAARVLEAASHAIFGAQDYLVVARKP